MIMFTGLLAIEYHDLHLKSRQVCNKTRSPPSSRLFKGQGTKHTTVKWPIVLHCIIYNTNKTDNRIHKEFKQYVLIVLKFTT